MSKCLCFSRWNPKLLLFALLVLVACASPSWARKKKASPPTVAQQIEQILSASPIANGFFGIQVYSIDHNQIIYEKDAGKLFIPASNAKIFTTATALAKLPTDFRFHTTLESSGRIDKSGRLNGDLIFVGRGDPNLSNRVLPYDPKARSEETPLVAIENLASQLVVQGVKFIQGDMVGDDSYFVNEPYGDNWGWDDLLWSWGASVSALTINDNVFSVSIVSGELLGDHALVTLDPFYPWVKVQNELITTAANTERRIQIERMPGSPVLRLWGTVPLDAKPEHELLSIEEPARAAAESLRAALRARGVIVHGDVRVHHLEPWELSTAIGARPPESAKRTILAEIVSRPLREDLKVTDKVSQNLHAEMLLRLLGVQLKHEGSVRAGLEAEKEFLKEAGVDEKDFFFNDGSGLSAHNVVAPRAIVQLLKYIWSQPYRDTFIDLLPISATDGTTVSRFKDTPWAGKIFAKTGTLTHVNALSGYATSTRGEHFIFSMITNNHTQQSKVATATLDKILETVLAPREPGTKKPNQR